MHGGYLLTEHLINVLRIFKTPSRNYMDAYLDLIYHLRDITETDPELKAPEREYFRHMILGMAAWHAAVADIWAA